MPPHWAPIGKSYRGWWDPARWTWGKVLATRGCGSGMYRAAHPSSWRMAYRHTSSPRHSFPCLPWQSSLPRWCLFRSKLHGEDPGWIGRIEATKSLGRWQRWRHWGWWAMQETEVCVWGDTCASVSGKKHRHKRPVHRWRWDAPLVESKRSYRGLHPWWFPRW